MSPLRRPLFLLAAVLLGPCAFAVNGRIETAARWAENINRASSPVDWRDAWQLETRGALSLFRELQTGLIVSGEADVLAEHTPKFRALDAVSAGAGVTVRQKFGLGAFAPSLAVDAGLRARDTRLDLDSGVVATAAVRLTQRLLPVLRAGLHGDWEQHYARSAVYDTKHHRFFATLAWDITPWLQLSHGNGRLWGSFTANASAPVWARALSGALGSHISDYYLTVFRTPSGTFGPGWVTYLIDGRVSFFWLELSPALGRNTSLPLRFENRVSVNKVGVKYRQDIWTLALLHRF